MQIVIDGLITEYSRVGKGPVMLFLHGWGDTSKTYGGLVDTLKADFTCVLLDQPGFGATEVPEGAWTLASYAEFIQHFLQKLGISQTEVIVGHSHGGAVAIRGLENGLLSAKKLVLLASSGIRPKKNIKTSIITLAAKAGKHITKILPKANQLALRKALYRRVGSDYLVAPQMAETFKKVVRDDISAGLGDLRLPVLLIYGQKDTATPLWIAKKFQVLLPQATLHIVPLAGHFVHLDAQAETLHAIKEFLQ